MSVNFRLLSWADNSHVLDANQFSFQRKSTTDSVFILQSIISKILSTGNKLYCAFIDYSKAFDKTKMSVVAKVKKTKNKVVLVPK